MTPGPYYSKDIKNLGILNSYNVKYGCDSTNIVFEDIINMIKDGYYIMLESMINYSHWLVLLGYYTYNTNDIEKAKLLMYDPYYNEIRLVNADEFITMWIDGDYENSHIEKDYIAIQK